MSALRPARASSVRDLAISGVVMLVAFTAAMWVLPGEAVPAVATRVNVRWPPDVGVSERAELERELGLLRPEAREGTAWSYELADSSSSGLERLVRHPRVEDTHGIDRERYVLVDAPDVGVTDSRLTAAVTVATMLVAVATLIGFWLGVGAGAALAAPLVLGFVCIAALAAAAAGGTVSVELSAPEAAATGDLARLSVMIDAGADFSERAQVRPGILGDRAREVTAFEAAVLENLDSVLDWMLRHMPSTPATLADLMCLADRHERDQSRAVLVAFGAPESVDCSAYEEPR